ncbi:MAG: hypothetical protein IK120_07305, partial [Muribaculaceae bacterium]|nr:hypothetical protein [Muribaculaceae bacterium]
MVTGGEVVSSRRDRNHAINYDNVGSTVTSTTSSGVYCYFSWSSYPRSENESGFWNCNFSNETGTYIVTVTRASSSPETTGYFPAIGSLAGRWDKDVAPLIKTLVVGAGVTSINSANIIAATTASLTGLETIDLSNSDVTTIAEHTFNASADNVWQNLKTISLPASLESIGVNAFYNFTGLSRLTCQTA